MIAVFTQSGVYMTHPGCTTFLLLGADTMFCSLLDSHTQKSSFGYIDDIMNLAWKKVLFLLSPTRALFSGGNMAAGSEGVCFRDLRIAEALVFSGVMGKWLWHSRLWAALPMEVRSCGHSLAIRLQPKGLPNLQNRPSVSVSLVFSKHLCCQGRKD